jgi:hypothetical protein
MLVLRALLTVGPAGALGAVEAAAQSADANRVAEGDTVRVMVSERALPVTASFLGWEGEWMLLDVDGVDGSWSVNVFDLHRLELLTERTSREGLRHGVVLGGAAGLFVGAAVGVVLDASGVTNDPNQPPGQIVGHAITGGAIGILVGALAGGLYRGRRPGRGWVNLGLPGPG